MELRELLEGSCWRDGRRCIKGGVLSDSAIASYCATAAPRHSNPPSAKAKRQTATEQAAPLCRDIDILKLAFCHRLDCCLAWRRTSTPIVTGAPAGRGHKFDCIRLTDERQRIGNLWSRRKRSKPGGKQRHAAIKRKTTLW